MKKKKKKQKRNRRPVRRRITRAERARREKIKRALRVYHNDVRTIMRAGAVPWRAAQTLYRTVRGRVSRRRITRAEIVERVKRSLAPTIGGFVLRLPDGETKDAFGLRDDRDIRAVVEDNLAAVQAEHGDGPFGFLPSVSYIPLEALDDEPAFVDLFFDAKVDDLPAWWRLFHAAVRAWLETYIVEEEEYPAGLAECRWIAWRVNT